MAHPIANRPAVLAVDKTNVGQAHIVDERFGTDTAGLNVRIAGRRRGRSGGKVLFAGQPENRAIRRGHPLGVLLRNKAQQQYQGGRCEHGFTIDSDVANDLDSTANTAVPAEFAGVLAVGGLQ